MNITARNEFETIAAFTTIAGSTFGGWAYREICVEVLEALDSIVGFSETFELWKELARNQDYQLIECEFADELRDFWNDHVDTMPDYCTLEWQDNELIVLPDVDGACDELPRMDAIPDEHAGDQILHVNDHGNVDYCYWDESRREYVIGWSVV